jgi:hypothetical protein
MRALLCDYGAISHIAPRPFLCLRRLRSVVLGGAQRPRRRGGARQHAPRQRSAVLGGEQRRSAALSARGGAAMLDSTWLSSDLRRSVAFSGARRLPAPAAARRCSAARGIVALGDAGFGTWWRSEAGARRRTVALGGTP